MKKFYLTLLTLFLIGMVQTRADEGIRLTFNRTGTNAGSVSVTATDCNNGTIAGVSAQLVSASHAFKGTGGAVTAGILCPNVNGNTSPTITLLFAINGLPNGFKYQNIGVDLHALNSGGNYQANNDQKQRRWNVTPSVGAQQNALTDFGTLTGIDIAAGVGSAGSVHKVWSIEKTSSTAANATTYYVKLTITASSSTNVGCFIGISSIELTAPATGEGDGGEEEEDDGTLKAGVYNISWKNTGANYAGENDDRSISVGNYETTKRIFWEFIATGKANCFYIKNTATGRYIGSCNLTPSSASRIYTTDTPVEYYVQKTAATTAEIGGCYYLSSTDCNGHASEGNNPRALNKDGASQYVITWTAGTAQVGSYWKLVATEDLYELRPFEPSQALGSVFAAYTLGIGGNKLSIDTGDNIITEAGNTANDYQGWYFVGTSNREGYLIASAQLTDKAITANATGAITLTTGNGTRWAIHQSDDINKYYFKSIETGLTLTIDGDSLFTIEKKRSAYARNTQIYNNPCGTLSNNYIREARLHGDDVLKTITYESAARPSSWHVLYTADRGTVSINGTFQMDITLAQAASEDLVVFAYFDWNADGIFETTRQMEVNGTSASGTFTTPDWAVTKETRMRVRVNEHALNLPEDDVQGVAYDFIITAAPMQEGRTVTTAVNTEGRGTATLSATADSYAVGTTLTATATPAGSSTFVCWKEGNIIVSTDAKYTFEVDHNIALTAYFTPDPEGSDDITTAIGKVTEQDGDIAIEQRGNAIVATSINPVTSILIYNSNAMLIKQANSDTVTTASLPAGIYIVKVRTTAGEKNFKIFQK